MPRRVFLQLLAKLKFARPPEATGHQPPFSQPLLQASGSGRGGNEISRPSGWRSVREIGLFLLISTALCLTLFWPAATGAKLFAPLDIPANFFSKFSYLNPAATGVPDNHYMVDLMLGDVSRNLLVYQAWERGEMPWWDPYTDGGKPLAAEANAVNVSDPFKVLLYHLLPFELAYNWVRIVPFILSGVGAFGLLRYFGFGLSAAGWGGLLYQFAGCNIIMFSGPTVQASFACYPLLWLLWDRGVEQGQWRWFLWSGAVTALIFLSGNLQSHSYPFLFALAFCIGYGWRRPRRWARLIPGIGLALGIGLCLAAPFLFCQAELFFLSARKLPRATSALGMFTGLASVAVVFPWALGTFRTVDASKLVDQYALGFWTYIGSAALIIAVLGACVRPEPGSIPQDRRRTSLALIAVYLVVCSTPLLQVLYTRTSWLAVLGLGFLFAQGWVRLTSLSKPLPRWGWAVLALAVIIAVALNVGGWIIYPRWESKIEAIVLAKQAGNLRLDEATALRKFQVANFSNEVTFENRETVVAFAGLLALGVFLLRAPGGKRVWLHLILVLSTLPLLWFGQRYIPMHPIGLWERIRAGGPEQRRVVEAVRERGLRLREIAPGSHEMVFPGALSQLFKVHTLHGHSSLVLTHAGGITNETGGFDPANHDLEYRSATRGLERGDLVWSMGTSPARFRWAGPEERPVSIVGETLNTITLKVGPGPAGELIRTDTYYPGWGVAPGSEGVSMAFEPPCFARLQVPADTTHLRLVYSPRWLGAGICIAAGAGLVLISSLVGCLWRLRKSGLASKPAT